jgi:RHS repeat-associated protein
VLWCETAICEERAADGVTVTRRAFGLGEQVNGTARFFTTDHLGSVREVTDATGTLLARYAFDPWGRRTVTAGTDVTTVGFTGHRTHTSSGLALALYRGYDAGLGRWVSDDPMGMMAGINYQAYVVNTPITTFDPLGLAGQKGISPDVVYYICCKKGRLAVCDGPNQRGDQFARKCRQEHEQQHIDEMKCGEVSDMTIEEGSHFATILSRGVYTMTEDSKTGWVALDRQAVEVK